MRHQAQIPLNNWQTFAEQFSLLHEGERVSLFAQRAAGMLDPIARDVIFRNLGCDIEGGQRSVVVTVDTNGERHMSHTISKAAAIMFDGKTVNVRSELGSGFTIELASKEAVMTPLNEWGFDIEKFETKAKQSIDNARGDLSEVTGVLRESLARTKQALLDLQKSGGPVADELRNGFERAWEEIEQAFARARKRVRESRDAAAARKAGDEWLG